MPKDRQWPSVWAYAIATLVIAGGGLMLFVTRGDSEAQNMQVIVAGFVGSALTWVFSAETGARSARQSERSYAAGVAVPTIPGGAGAESVTVSSTSGAPTPPPTT